MTIKKLLLLPALALISLNSFAQKCDCQTEFTYIKNFMEKNYAGFKDKKAQMGDAAYKKMTDEYLAYSKKPNANETCLLVISSYLDKFKDHHVSIGVKFDAMKTDSAVVKQRQIIQLTDAKIEELRKSKTEEGIYIFRHDSSYRIAVYKDSTLLHDYVGVIIDSKLPGWKRGMLKFASKKNDEGNMKGILFVRNQLPKVEYFNFFVNNTRIGGDWVREGATFQQEKYDAYVPVASRKLTDKTLYIKISNFGTSNYKNIDSVFKANDEALKAMPYLVLDLRGNGGGDDYSYSPILPYIYTNPIKTIGADVLSTAANIAGWKKELEDPDMAEETKNDIKGKINNMEKNVGKFVTGNDDYTNSDMKVLSSPKKVVVLIDKGCASTTEQFLFEAIQSKKVVLMGEHTSGTLDYSNVREAPFSCMPYILRYSTSRSRRLDVGQGIDNIGIKPNKALDAKEDWLKAAIAELEK
ncbi:hypothetical protein FFF34_006460 [Inquilinus sp. KBS0705]|nr:hypothetical protein FFF34_006460 [Inquilinus sp. KBS0705]